MRITGRAVLATTLRVGVSALLIGTVLVVVRREGLDWRSVWPGTGTLVAAALLWLVGVGTLALRFRILSAAEALSMSHATALRLTLEGHALGQVSPGLVGGDIWRSLRLVKLGLPTAASVRVVVLDRVAGLLGLALLAWLAWCWEIAWAGRTLLAAIALAAPLLLLAAAFAGRVSIARMAHGRLAMLDAVLARLAKPPRVGSAPALIALSVAGHILNCAAFLTLGTGLGLQVPLATGVAILSVAFFLAALPVAFGGWGAREAAIAAGFVAIGQDPALAVATSIAYGLMVLAGGLPGLLLVVLPRKRLAAGA